MDFEKLMAKAMAVTQQQDAALAEKARRKLQEEDERRMRELKAERERQRLQEQLERKKSEQKQQQLKDKKKRKGQVDNSNNKKSNSNKLTTSKRSNSKSNAIAALQQLQPSAQKKDMSFEELMAQANKLQQKKQSDPPSKIPSSSSSMSKKNERSTISGKRPPTSVSSSHTPRNNNTNNNNDHNKNNNNNNNTPSIYRNRPSTTSKSIRDSTRPIPTSTLNMSARDKVRQMMRQPPQKLNTQKRDLRSISEIQRDIRHKKGIYSDGEEDTRSDPRLLQNKRVSSENRHNNKMSSGPLPSSRSSFPAGKRPAGSAAAAMMNRNRNIGDSRRMPFSRPVPERRRPIQRYDEEELDEEMDDFVVNDEEEEEEVNDYSAEIGRIFRYNKKRYRNETFSDDDMEADAREVLREEKRSERIGRREDIEEEKRELERLKRLKTKGKSRS
ncbi:SPT2 chromatin protein-domain-containing protein [Circinella umbellata]|nr:SPT2 chromatin protein-domain-containing protein [Circinella umbellata]